MASHDLRSPLNTIGDFAQLLSLSYMGKLDPGCRRASIITDAVARMHALIDDLLAFARSAPRPLPPKPSIAPRCSTA